MILTQNKLFQLIPFVLLLVLFLLGSLMDVMDVDAAQYATISQEMMHNGSFLEVFLRGEDYLDKPPLLFWVSALSFKLFGVSNFSFRLIPILLSFAGFYATYRLAKLYYNEVISYLAALLIASSQAYILMNHDLRTDNMLTSLVVLSVWQIAAYLRSNQWKHLVYGALFIGLAMLAKGPIGIMAPAYAFFVDTLLKRKWQNFFKWQWLVALVIIGIVLLPMSWGLYTQFDLPKKETSGLRFFYWTQSFGRITGESTWDNNPDPLFQVHSFLWGFLPWSLLALFGYGRQTVSLIKGKMKLSDEEEGITWGGVTLIFLSMSLSKFQLPHYTYPAFPLVAIIGARFIYYLGTVAPKKFFRWGMAAQLLTVSALWLLSSVMLLWIFPTSNIVILGVMLAGLTLVVLSLWKLQDRLDRLIVPAFLSVLAANILMNVHIYPSLLQYQSETQAARYLRSQNIATDRIYRSTQENWYSFDFYLGKSVPIIHDVESYPKIEGIFWAYVDQDALASFRKLYPNVQVVKSFDEYHITVLTGPFLDPKTRPSTLQKVYLIKVGQ